MTIKYIKVNNDKIDMTVKEFDELIKQVENDAYEKGKKDGDISITNPPYTPNPYGTGAQPYWYWDWTKVTCEDSPDVYLTSSTND